MTEAGGLLEWIRQFLARLSRSGTFRYVGIATIRGEPGFRMPVYPQPKAEGQPIGYLAAGRYAPHFRAAARLGWLEVTLPNGDRGWLQNDPARVSITRPQARQIRVCVDPGHGGSDSGAVGNGLTEKAVNLDIAFDKLGRRLLGDRRIHQVWFTRTADEDVSLAYRADLANAAGARLFVSVHNNSFTPVARGTETYFKGGAEAQERVKAQSQRAACLVHARLRQQMEGAGLEFVDRGVINRLLSESDLRSYYYVLRNAEVPAILVECLFISNPDEARHLADEQFRDRLGQAIYEGILDALFSTAAGNACSFKTYYGL